MDSNAKLMYDISSDSSVAIRVLQRLRALAKELHLEEYVERDELQQWRESYNSGHFKN